MRKIIEKNNTGRKSFPEYPLGIRRFVVGAIQLPEKYNKMSDKFFLLYFKISERKYRKELSKSVRN